jgi:hypothetical protein
MAALRNFSRKNAKRFRVLTSEASYRRRGDVRGVPGAPDHRGRGLGSTRTTLGCG